MNDHTAHHRIRTYRSPTILRKLQRSAHKNAIFVSKYIHCCKLIKSKDLYNSLVRDLLTVYPYSEAQSITSMLLEALYNINQIALITNQEIAPKTKAQDKLKEAMGRLLLQEPVQYVLGKAHFYGKDFIVNPNVLIPRKETEELVHLMISDHPNFKGNILDLGTGSGCIPITLSLAFPQSKTEAVDVSHKALNTAIDNAKSLHATVDFYQFDILSSIPLRGFYDLIVSNPPYVMNKEKKQMQQNVLDNEPHLALFVEDDNPLIFYKAIINKAIESLNKEGKLYFEINEQLGREVAEEMKSAGFENVEVIKDMQEKNRIVRGTLRR